ncbi:uncharacterized protein LOC128678165 [Plodia interpunctella]|uniref:uncharacterized protein LOC128678165 n=1 Tax=Plodia interpunctella TaxID=58824 RepID=UPI0023678BAF|nr:uncharacterized protein LOC128678165 [Plodia interpunctella]
MVIQEDNEMPLEQSSRKNNDFKVIRHEMKMELLKNELQQNLRHKRKKIKQNLNMVSEDLRQEKSSCDENSDNVDKYSETDLEELRSIYKKCKSIIKKMESKYGHLLGVDSSEQQSELKNQESEKCTCALNKKIVFDDDGTEITQEPNFTRHICPKKLKVKHNLTETNTLQIEYEIPDTLPEDLLSLSHLLRDPGLETTVRNKIINKIRLIKQEYTNEVKFNKHAIIEKIKLNPDEMIDFHGTNLSSLPGYTL